MEFNSLLPCLQDPQPVPLMNQVNKIHTLLLSNVVAINKMQKYW